MRPALRPVLSVTRVALWGGACCALAGAAGYYTATRFNPGLVGAVLKYATGIIAVVWFFALAVYNKLSDVTDLPGLDYRQHRNLEQEVRSRLQWFWVRAFFLAVLAVVLNLPNMMQEVKLPVHPYFYAAAAGALGLALYSVRGVWLELEDIRQLRSHIKEMERTAKERDATVKNLKGAEGGGWEADASLDGFRAPARRARRQPTSGEKRSQGGRGKA